MVKKKKNRIAKIIFISFKSKKERQIVLRISPLNNIRIGFKSQNFDYTSDATTYARYLMRKRLEESLGSEYLYSDEMQHLTSEQVLSQLDRKASANLYAKHQQSSAQTTADYNSLQKLKLFVKEKRKNELYSGGKLSTVKNGIETAAQAGIKTVVYLANDYDRQYEKAVKEAGLNFISLEDLDSKRNYAINRQSELERNKKIIRNLINYPDNWATKEENGETKRFATKDICDLQSLFDILDGKNPNFPPPIYFGCDFGSGQTYAWATLYNILRDEDRTKPLSEETITKLIKFENREFNKRK